MHSTAQGNLEVQGSDVTQLLVPDLAVARPVSDAEVARFQRDGHISLTGVATADEAAAYCDVITAAVDRRGRDPRPLAERDTYGKAFLQVENLWVDDPEVAQFVLSARFAGIAAQLLGVKNVRLYHDQALIKEAGGGITPWHQDAMYWPLDGTKCITMWMPLVDITTDMGVLTFATGSHARGALTDIEISDASEGFFDDLVASEGFEVTVPGPMSAGDASFHAGWTVHRASGNTSVITRTVMTMIWFDADLVVQDPSNPAQHRDLANWLPGCLPGDPAASSLNPRLGY